MASGVLVGILKEQHADCIVLGDTAPIPLPAGLILDRFDAGTLVSIDYIRDSDGVMLVQGMKRGALGAYYPR
jgi:hypothetical protein